MPLIAIGDGHGIETAGKRTPPFANGSVMKENEFNSAVVNYLEAELKRNGFKVLQTAPESSDTPLSTRAKRANQAGADLYVSVHANAFGSTWNDANGVESWIYSAKDAKTYDAAKKIQSELIKATGLKDRGIKESGDNLGILRDTKMPAVLVECGFMTNRSEAELLKNDFYRRKCAEAICKGICKYYGVNYTSGVNEVPEKRYNKVDELPYGRDVIERLINEGVLYGDENGNLNLSDDMVRIFMVLDRKEIL